MERYEIVVDDDGNHCGLIPSENGSVVKYADAQATVEALQQDRDALKIGLNALRDSYDELESRHNDTTAALDAERERLITEYVRLFRLCEPIVKMLSELSILPIGCSREQELAWKMAVKNFRHYQRVYAADVLLQAALTPAAKGGDDD